MWNRHREFEIHDIHEIGWGTKLFITFELKVIRHEERERETQSFYADCFYIVSSQPNQRAAPVAHKVVCPRPGMNLDSLVWRQELNFPTFSKSQNPQPTLPGMTSFTAPSPISYLGFLFWHLWTTHPPRVRVNTCAHVCTWLTHALSRKVLILTKPKDKIYKTKSLRNYITPCRFLFFFLFVVSCFFLFFFFFFRNELHYDVAFFWDSSQLTQVCYSVYNTWNLCEQTKIDR